MTTFQMLYDTKAEKQYQALDAESQQEIALAIKQDELVEFGKTRGVNSFYWVSSERYRILLHVEPSNQLMRVFDIRSAKVRLKPTPALKPETAPSQLRVEYEPKAEKQLNALSAEIQTQNKKRHQPGYAHLRKQRYIFT